VAAKQRICVAGASLAGLRAAETLRAEGYDGIITVIGEEPEPPCNRPPDATTLAPCERTGGRSLAYTRRGDLVATAALDTPRAIAVARRQLVAGVPEDEGDLRVTA